MCIACVYRVYYTGSVHTVCGAYPWKLGLGRPWVGVIGLNAWGNFLAGNSSTPECFSFACFGKVGAKKLEEEKVPHCQSG